MCERYEDKHLKYFVGNGASKSTSMQQSRQMGPNISRQVGEQTQFGALDNQSFNKFITKGVPHQPQYQQRQQMASLDAFKH